MPEYYLIFKNITSNELKVVIKKINKYFLY